MLLSLLLWVAQASPSEPPLWELLGRIVTVTTLVGAASGAGYYLWSKWRGYVQWRAIEIHFAPGRTEPYYIESYEFPEGGGGPGHLRRLFRIGVTNKSDQPLQVRAVVEHIDTSKTAERRLRVWDGDDGQSEAVALPRRSAKVFFELVDTGEDEEMACLCFAQPVNECYVGRYATVRVRVEGGEANAQHATFVITTHGKHGVKVPFSVERLD